MRVETHIDQFITVEVSVAELVAHYEADELPEDELKQWMAWISRHWAVFKYVPDEIVEKLSDKQRDIIASALRDQAARYERQLDYPDGQRMDWIERECHDIAVSADASEVTRASDGRSFVGDSLREAVDLALIDEQSPTARKPEPSRD